MPGRIEAQGALIRRPPEPLGVVHLVARSRRGSEAARRAEISTSLDPEPGLVRIELAKIRSPGNGSFGRRWAAGSGSRLARCPAGGKPHGGEQQRGKSKLKSSDHGVIPLVAAATTTKCDDASRASAAQRCAGPCLF